MFDLIGDINKRKVLEHLIKLSVEVKEPLNDFHLSGKCLLGFYYYLVGQRKQSKILFIEAVRIYRLKREEKSEFPIIPLVFPYMKDLFKSATDDMVLIDAFNWHCQQDLGRVFVEPLTLAFYILFRLTKKIKYLQSFSVHQGYLDEHVVERCNEKDPILDEDIFDWYYRQTIGTMILFYQKIKSPIRTKYYTREKERQRSKYRFLCCRKKKLRWFTEEEEKIPKHLFARQNMFCTNM